MLAYDRISSGKKKQQRRIGALPPQVKVETDAARSFWFGGK